MSTPQPLNFKYTNAISCGIERPKTRIHLAFALAYLSLREFSSLILLSYVLMM